MSKTSFSWYENLILYPVVHLRVRHILIDLSSVYRDDAYKYIQLISIVESACLKGSYSSENVDLDPSVI